MKTMTTTQRPALAAAATRLRYTPAPQALSLRPDLMARLPAHQRPVHQPTAQPAVDTVDRVAEARRQERARASRLLVAATESPLLTHYQRLAAMPSPGSSERPATWGMKARAIILLAIGLGFGLGVAISGVQLIAAMMGK